jgi:hypothetical protein
MLCRFLVPRMQCCMDHCSRLIKDNVVVVASLPCAADEGRRKAEIGT